MDTTLTRLAAGVATFIGARAVFRRLRQIDMKDRVVIITGGTRGLGLALARELQRQGARIAICSRAGGEVERARAELAQHGPVFAETCDVTDPASIDQFVEHVVRREGRLDGLINNAGEIQIGPMAAMTYADYDAALKTHLWGPLHASLAVIPHMRKQRFGRIVNIASIGGKVAVPHLLPYSASKFALVGLSQGMHAELARHDIVVTTVCPGLMRTGSARKASLRGRDEHAWFTAADNMPGLSMSAERAARRIVLGMRRGEAEVMPSVLARVAALANALMPNLTQDALGFVERMLPAGADTPKWLAARDQAAAETHNQR